MTLSGFSNMSYKVAGALITAFIIAIAGITYGFTVGNKVEKADYDMHCLGNERDFSQFQWELSAQRGVYDMHQIEIEKIKKENQDLKIILEDINGKFNLIMYRLERIEKKIDK